MDSEKSPRIATCIYNATDDMWEMLRVFVYSALKETGCDIHVYQSCLTKKQRAQLLAMSPRVHQKRIEFECGHPEHKASQKIRIWRKIDQDHMGHDLILADFDMLFVGDPTPLFREMMTFEGKADICFTAKDDQHEKYRLNTGVLFRSRFSDAREFFGKWEAGIEMLAGNLVAAEVQVCLHGALDQAWLASLLHQKDYFQLVRVPHLWLQAVKASVYNLHKDWSRVPDECCLIHFKSNWPHVLLHGDDFSSALEHAGWNKAEAKTWEPSFRLWRNCYNELNQKESSHAGRLD